MAFLLDKRIAAESEDEFDAETDRYEELRSRLLGGQTMKYEEMEELLAAAKARNDQRVIGVLKNVVDDPATDGAGPLAEAAGDIFRNSPAMAVLIDALRLKYEKTGNVFYAFMPNRPEQQVFMQIKGGRKLYKVQVSPATAEEQAYWEKRGGFEMFQPQGDLAESGKEPTKSELLDKLIKMCKPDSGLRAALEEIKDKFALDESNTYIQDGNDADEKKDAELAGLKAEFDKLYDKIQYLFPSVSKRANAVAEKFDKVEGVSDVAEMKKALQELKDLEYEAEHVDYERAYQSSLAPSQRKEVDESNTYVQDDNDLDAADDELWGAIDRLAGRKDLTADECEWDAQANVLILTYKGIGWYEGHAAGASGPAEGGGFAEEVEDDVESDLTKIHDEFLKSSGFDFEFTHDSVKTAIADAAELVKKDGEEAISQKENRFGDWDYTADCVVRIPCKLAYGPAQINEVDPDAGIVDDVEEKEELLPDCVVNEAVETLRRMY